jgi:hypothetical protein
MGNPLIAAACLAWLGFDAWRLSHTLGSSVGSSVWHTLHSGIRCSSPHAFGQIVLVPEGDAFVVGNSDGMSYDEMARAFATNSGAIVVEYEIHWDRLCFWAPMSVTNDHRFMISPLADTTLEAYNAAQKHLPAAREAYAKWLASNGRVKEAADARLAPRTERIVLWGGIARNAAALAAFALLSLSLVHAPAWVRERRARQRARSWEGGGCPGCGYRVESLARCPECGAERETGNVEVRI